MQHKQKCRFFSLILCFTLLISALTPVNAYAKSYKPKQARVVAYTITGDLVSNTTFQDLPIDYRSSDVKAALLEEIYLYFKSPTDFDKGDTFTFTVKTWEWSRFVSWSDVSFSTLEGSWGYSANYKYDRATGVYSFSQKILEPIYKDDTIRIQFYKPHYPSDFDATASGFVFKVDSIEYDVLTAEEADKQGFFENIKQWFNNIFEWLSNIRDNISNGFSNIGTWFSQLGNNIKSWFADLTASLKGFFTDLGNKISDFFTNLTNNLKTWFQNVGKWFSELGDKISDFFTNLWNNISGTVTDIRVSISDWWQGVVEWFHNLFVPEDGFFENYKERFDKWFEDHFGAVYQSIELSDMLIDMFFGDDTIPVQNNFIIKIPALKVPVVNVTIYKGQDIWFSEIGLSKSSTFNTILTMFRVMVSVIVYFSLIMFAKKTFEEVLADREL